MNKINMPITRKMFNGKAMEKILFIVYYEPNGLATVAETIAYIQQYSHYNIEIINLCIDRMSDGSLGIPERINIDDFDGLLIHNTVSYNPDVLELISESLDGKLTQFKGAKIVFKQDENHKYIQVANFIGMNKFDAVLTCLNANDIEKIYPKNIVGDVKFVKMLTGYVTPTLRNFDNIGRTREIDIGYRGSIQPLSFGRLAYEKKSIGDNVKFALANTNLKLDISSLQSDRMYGINWLNFLASCKATLGVESGASAFSNSNIDLDALYKLHTRDTPNLSHADEEEFLDLIKPCEGYVKYNQISPRHFEAAATRTLQIMYPGYYSGIFIADKHYVVLQRDLSNLTEVIETLQNDVKRTQIISDAYNDIILNETYWIETFSSNIDALIGSIIAAKKACKPTNLITDDKKNNVALFCSHEPTKDPRLGWIANYAPNNMRVIQIGVSRQFDVDTTVNNFQTKNPVITLRRIAFDGDFLIKIMSYSNKNLCADLAINVTLRFNSLLSMTDDELCNVLAVPSTSARLPTFRWYLQYFLDTCATLIDHYLGMAGVELIVATDLDTLIPAIYLKGITGVPIIYDAHEFWPEADAESDEYEINFWIELERLLVREADYCQTVSSGLAEIMTNLYNIKFNYVPNCEPLMTSAPKYTNKDKKNHIDLYSNSFRFIYQGSFAPHRGIDVLIKNWVYVSNGAMLLLRGPDSEYKNEYITLAESLNLLNRTVFFIEPVDETDLVAAAKVGDVGIIPYTNYGTNYQNCCPNKMSQYMKAGLPILANNTNYVSHIIRRSETGLVINYQNRKEFLNAVSVFISNSDFVKKMSVNSYKYFEQEFHWEKVSNKMYDEFNRIIGGELSSSKFSIHVNNIKDNNVLMSIDEHVQQKNLSYLRYIFNFMPYPVKYSLKVILTKLGLMRFF